jgi:hypothetical protein
MYPDWVLYLNSSFGFVGIFIGTRIIGKKVKIMTGIWIDFLILLAGGLSTIMK